MPCFPQRQDTCRALRRRYFVISRGKEPPRGEAGDGGPAGRPLPLRLQTSEENCGGFSAGLTPPLASTHRAGGQHESDSVQPTTTTTSTPSRRCPSPTELPRCLKMDPAPCPTAAQHSPGGWGQAVGARVCEVPGKLWETHGVPGGQTPTGPEWQRVPRRCPQGSECPPPHMPAPVVPEGSDPSQEPQANTAWTRQQQGGRNQGFSL